MVHSTYTSRRCVRLRNHPWNSRVAKATVASNPLRHEDRHLHRSACRIAWDVMQLPPSRPEAVRSAQSDLPAARRRVARGLALSPCRGRHSADAGRQQLLRCRRELPADDDAAVSVHRRSRGRDADSFRSLALGRHSDRHSFCSILSDHARDPNNCTVHIYSTSVNSSDRCCASRIGESCVQVPTRLRDYRSTAYIHLCYGLPERADAASSRTVVNWSLGPKKVIARSPAQI